MPSILSNLITLSVSVFMLFTRTTCSSGIAVQDWTDEDLLRIDTATPNTHRIILFYADWCGACRRYKPKFAKTVPKLPALSPYPLEIIQIDLDKGAGLGSRFRISHLPSLFHQSAEDGKFRKIDGFKEDLEGYFGGKLWGGVNPMGALNPPRNKKVDSKSSSNPKFNLIKSIQDTGIPIPLFVLLFSTLLLFIVFFFIWCIWLYTDNKLNAHNFTDEAVKERIKFLRTLPEFEEEFEEDVDSGEESDTESEVESGSGSGSGSGSESESGSGSESGESRENKTETVSLRGRRLGIKNRLK